ncbi:MAG: hypothetical protein ACOYN3_01710 [Acidimicrobiia bacterium]
MTRDNSVPMVGRTCIVDAARPAWAEALARAGSALVLIGPNAGGVAASLPVSARTLVFAGDPENPADLLAVAEMMDECVSEGL